MERKSKGDGKNKGGNPYQQQQPPQINVAQQASSGASQAPEKSEVAQAEESWGYDYDTYWTDDWSTHAAVYVRNKNLWNSSMTRGSGNFTKPDIVH